MGLLDATRDWSRITQELNTPLEVERERGLLDVGEVYKHRIGGVGTYTYQDGDNGVYTGQVIVQHVSYLPVVFRQYAP